MINFVEPNKPKTKHLDDILFKPIDNLSIDDILKLHSEDMIQVYELRDLHCKDATTYDIIAFYLRLEDYEFPYGDIVFEHLGDVYGATSYATTMDAVIDCYKFVILNNLKRLARLFKVENGTLADLLNELTND